MPGKWFSRHFGGSNQDDVQPGNRYRRNLGLGLAATATVLELRPDLMGIPHVRFELTVELAAGENLDEGPRVLALESFLDTYRERLPSPSPS